MNRSVALICRELGSPAVTTTAGKLIAFEAHSGDKHVIIMEDAFPDTPKPISPLVTIHVPNLSADRDFMLSFGAVTSHGDTPLRR